MSRRYSPRLPALFESLESRRLFSGVHAAVLPTPLLPASVSATAVRAGGTGLTGEYFQGMNFNTSVLIRSDTKVAFRWVNNRPDQDIAIGGFSARWTGQVQPAATATYTFYTLANAGTRLWVNGNLVIDNAAATKSSTSHGSIAPQGGQKYDLRLEYTSTAHGIAAVKLMWSTPQSPRSVVPESALYPDATVALPAVVSGGNLVATYYRGKNFGAELMTRADVQIGFNWHEGSPDSIISAETPFSVRWTGTIVPATTGTYTFYTTTDDGVRLWINGQNLITDWHDQSSATRKATIVLQAGQSVDVRMDYYQNGVEYTSARLEWSAAGLPRQTVSFGAASGHGTVAAPDNLTAQAVSATRVDLAWNDVPGESGFVILRSANQGVLWSPLAHVAAQITTFSDTSVVAGTIYQYRVGAVQGQSVPNFGSVAAAQTQLFAPTQVTVAVAGTTAIVSWDAVANASTYEVDRSLDGVTGWQSVGTISSSTLTLTDTGLMPGTTYHYHVSAKDSAGDLATSTPVSITTALPVVSDVAATGIGTDVKIAWSGVSGATSYLIERSADGSTGWTGIGTTAATTWTDPDLANSTTYYYRVTAATLQADSNPSTVVSATTGPASALGVTAVATGNQITVGWNAVVGASGYSIERSADGSTGWSAIGATTTATSLLDPELTPGTTYYYRVVTNAATGDSLPSNIAGATTAPGIAAPTTVAADTTITVSWPVVPGAASYMIERSPDGSTGWTTLQASITSISLNDAGLLNGTNYYYRVTASNSAGSSPVSAVVSAKTGLGLPTLSASVTNYTGVVLNWNSVAGATEYTLRRSIDGGTTWNTAGTTSSTTLTDAELVPDGTYEYQVIATDGTQTSASNNVVITLPPAQPVTVSAVASGTTITITWAPVADAASYLVERSPDGSTSWTTAGTTTSACTLADTGLINDTTYFYRVTAIGAGGSSPLSSVVSAKTALLAPDLTAAINNYTSVTLSWNAVTGATSYSAQRSTDGGSTWTPVGATSGTSLADTGLTPDTTYTYQVIATDGVLTTASNNVAVTLSPASPVAQATASGTTITISWMAVPDAASYLVERSPDGTSNWSTAGTTTSTLTLADVGLSTGTTYYYRVTAIDTAGSSAPSAVVNATTIPLAPSSLTATAASDTQVNLSWTAAPGATGYIVQVSADGSTGWTQLTTVSGTTTSVGGLTASTTYYFRVMADNAAGVSGASTVANATTNGAAPTYSSLTTLYGLASTADGGGFYDVYSIDQTTGADTAIGHLAFGTAAGGRDPVSGKFFYISSGVSTVNIDSWDPDTNTNAVVTASAVLGGNVSQAAFRDDGAFFFTDSAGDLYQDNTTTDIVTRRGVIKLNGNPFASSNGDIAFGPDGNLYMEVSSTMYVIAGSAITNATGASPIPITLIGATGTGGSNNLQIAFGQNGVLFGTGGGTGHIGQLYTINTSTGTATAIGTAGTVAMGDLASVALYADLSVTQSVTSLTHGQQGTYTMTVANAGPDGTIKPITLTDTLPAGVTFVSGSGNGWTFYVNGQTVQAVYAANASASSTLPAITLLVAVDPSVTSSVTNSVTVSTTIFDQNLSNNTSSLTSPVS
jgi:uncharacterized repeat protein (TIGR01451 family)